MPKEKFFDPRKPFQSQRPETHEEWQARMGGEVLAVVRSGLYLDFRFLDMALSALTPAPDERCRVLATDGQTLYYQPQRLLQLYQENPKYLNRLYLHTIFHCVFRHLWLKGRREPQLWSLACDIAVENVIDSLQRKIVTRPLTYVRQNAYRQITAEEKVVAAAPVYRWLTRQTPGVLRQLEREFVTDDHRLWPKDAPEQPQQMPTPLPQKTWQKIGERMQTELDLRDKEAQPEALEKPFLLFRENALRLLECCQDEFEKVFYRTLIDEQKRRSIACFTESNDNSAMWGHYADSHRGFCIEYDFQKILTACSEKCADVQHCTSLMMSPAIAPVIYADVRYDASQIILPLLLSRMADLAHTAIKPFYEDLLVIVKSLLTKSSVWSYENEWRMISMLPDNTLFCPIYSLKPTAVYIGVRTDEEAANTLYQICCEKDIPCYKMVPTYLSGSFSIRPVEYEMHVEVTDRLKQKNML